MTQPEISGSGIVQRITSEYLSAQQERFMERVRLAKLAGEHVWNALAQYAVGDPIAFENGGHLDNENLSGVFLGCYVCEQAFEPRLVNRRCPGEPKTYLTS